MRLSLLSGFELVCDGRPVCLPMSAQRLLAYVGIQERPIERTHIAGILWTDRPEERATANLRSALWRLHRPGHRLIESDSSRLRLASSVCVDVKEASALAHRIVNPGVACEMDDLSAGAFHGDLLPDWYDDWVLVERERFRQIRLHALEAGCERLTRSGRYAEAIEAGLGAVTGEPLRESANRVLIQAHIAEGNRIEARRQYERYRDVLRSDLGEEPSSEMKRLVGEL